MLEIYLKKFLNINRIKKVKKINRRKMLEKRILNYKSKKNEHRKNSVFMRVLVWS